MKEKRVVFDAGGVLFLDGSAALMELIAAYGHKHPVELEEHYRSTWHKPLMRGDIDEEYFWNEISQYAGVSKEDVEEIRHKLVNEVLRELPAVGMLKDWADRAELWILSNHRHEWLLDRLENAQIDELFHTVLVSSQLKTRKPELEMFTHLLSSDKQTVFIDDKQANLDMVHQFGYDTILADNQGNWHQQLIDWLDK